MLFFFFFFSTQCHDNHHNWEEHLEEWWAIDPEAEERPALKKWLCDDKLQVCCPEGTFGQDCSPCRVVDDQESNKTFNKMGNPSNGPAVVKWFKLC